MASSANSKGSSSAGNQTQGEGQAPQDIHVREPLTLILPDNNRFSSFLFSTFRRSASTIVVLLIIASVPVTMVLLSRPQDVRQRAEFQTTPSLTKKHNISGRVYIDTNNNGIRDSWENGPNSVTVSVSGDNIKIEVPTDPYGGYTFEKYGGLLPGLYTVTVNPVGGYTPITASTVNVKLGPENAIVDFGIQRTTDRQAPSL